MKLTGWGRYPRYDVTVVRPPSPEDVVSLQRELTGLIPRGNGRAYGDAAIGSKATVEAIALNRMLAFDSSSGCLKVEAGVLLSDVIETFLPRGFFPPVVPGTKFVTIGGMVAADVHGKNHHRDGGFGRYVSSLKLLLPNGELLECSASKNSELFAATIGGMGLTGIIVEVTFTLRRIETGWVKTSTVVAHDLAAAIRELEKTAGATYSVAWIDCLARGVSLGRSLVYIGEHAALTDLTNDLSSRDPFPRAPNGTIKVPVDFPSFALNKISVGLFNEFYFRRGASKAHHSSVVHWDPFFFPLDGIGAWNRIYGRRGFLQHQSVLPMRAAVTALQDILDRVSVRGKASFLAVLKLLSAGSGLMSFPLHGFTLAIDFPVSSDVLSLLEEIDRIVVEHGGRIYLAKDARQSRATFEAGYVNLPQFQEIRRIIGAAGRVDSRLSERLGV